MVLPNEIALIGGFGYSAWKILHDNVYQRQAKIAKALEDQYRHTIQKGSKDKAAGGTFCKRAKDEGQLQVVADYDKLPNAMKDSLAYDLAHLAAWANDNIKISDKPWAELSTEEKSHITSIADKMSFSWLSALHANQAKMSQAWLWEPSDSLPALSKEITLDPITLAALQESQTKLEACKKTAEALLSAERSTKLSAVKDAGKMLLTTKLLRDLQIIQTLMEDAGVDTKKSEAERGAEVKACLTGLTLRAASAELSAEVAAAQKAIKDSQAAAVEAARSEKMAVLEEAASKAAMQVRIAGANDTKKAEQWQTSALMWTLMSAELLLADLANTAEETAQQGELRDAVTKLVTKLAASINFDIPAELSEGLAGSAPNAVAAELAAALASAAAGSLEEEEAARVEKAKASKTPEQVVRSLVAEVMSNVTGVDTYVTQAAAEFEPRGTAELQTERNRIRDEYEIELTRAAATKHEADLAVLETELEQVGKKALDKALASLGEDLVSKAPSQQIAFAASSLETLEAKGASDKEYMEALSWPLLLLGELEAGTLSADAEQQVAAAAETLRSLKLGADVAKLEMGPGCVDVLLRMKQYIAARQAAPPAAPAVEEGEEGGEAAAPEADAAASTLAKAQEMIDGLLSEGLVLLELPLAAVKKLQGIFEAINAMSYGSDKMLFQRCLKSLESAVESDLPPIAAAIDTRLAALSQGSVKSSDPKVNMEDMTAAFTTVLEQTRVQAIQLFQSLTVFLKADKLHADIMAKSMPSIREKLAGVKVAGRRVDQCQAAITAVQEVKETIEAALQTIQDLKESEDVISDIYIFETKLDELSQVLEANLRYNRLRDYVVGKSTGPLEPVPTVPIDVSVSKLVQCVQDDTTPFEVLEMGEDDAIRAMTAEGMKLIARGKVAVCSVAAELTDGEVRATQDIGLPSTKALLQLFAERLCKVQALAAEATFGSGATPVRPTPWYIMTTPEAKPAVDAYLAEGQYFGLDPHQVCVFAHTPRLPHLRLDGGGILMETPGRVSKSPISSGDMLPALEASGLLKQMASRGIKYLDVHSREDNILAKPADPAFVGYLGIAGLEAGAKVTERPAIADVLSNYISAADPGAGAIPGAIGANLEGTVPCTGQYCFSMDFAKNAAKLAKRAVRCSPADGIVSRGSKVAGYKVERRLSDVLLEQRNAGARGLMVVDPSEEWALVWSSSAPEGANAAVDALLLLHTSWVEEAGGAVPDVSDESDENASNVVEVAPMVSYSGEGLEALVAERTFTEAYDLDLQGFAPQARKKNTLATWMLPFGIAYIAVAALKIAKK